MSNRKVDYAITSVGLGQLASRPDTFTKQCVDKSARTHANCSFCDVHPFMYDGMIWCAHQQEIMKSQPENRAYSRLELVRLT